MNLPSPHLKAEACRTRQQRLRERLADHGLDAALLTNPSHVLYFTNEWQRVIFAPSVLITVDGPVVLSTPTGPGDHLVADEVCTYPTNRLSTMVDNQPAVALEPLLPRLARAKRVGCDDLARPWLVTAEVVDLNDVLYALRRHKDDDEVTVIRRAVAACEAAYEAARQMLAPGVSEVQVYATMHAAAVVAAGEPIGELGNDFQAGTPGGPPRPRRVEAGELMPLDVTVVVRGYCCDLCRTFCVNRKPTDAQQKAHALVIEALEHVESRVRVGSSCKAIFEEVFNMLDGQHGWRFFHHLGHGIGLFPHEAPRLNPNWDDVFEVGDVFTVEPGLYGEDLNAGIRIEHNYLITERGLERLSQYPTDL